MTAWRVGDRVTHPDRGPGRVDSLAPNPLIVWVAFDREQEWPEVPTIVPVDRDILKAETPTPSPAELERLWDLTWPEPDVWIVGPLRVVRSRAGYGWTFKVGRRVAWTTTAGTSRDWPRVLRGSDEHCNRSVTVTMWPLGHLDVWWERRWRTEMCGNCAREWDAR